MNNTNPKDITVTFLIGNNNTGSASFNRFLALAKATSVKQNVRVAFIRPVKDKEEILKVMDELNLLDFIASEEQVKSSNQFSGIKGILQSFREIQKHVRNNIKSFSTKEIFFLYSTNLVDYKLYHGLAKKHGFKLVTERNEYPVLIREKVFLKSYIYKRFILPRAYRIFDGIVLMTDFLHKFYLPHLNKNTVVVKVPMTVDFQRFNIKKTETNEEYIFYAGSLIQQKDGIETLITAFLNIKESYPELKLKIAGGSSAEIDNLKNKLSILSDDRIEFLGLIPGKDIPGMLLNAKILMLPRPASKQAEGGFPTKLGEYLASGRPVIATPVGEIPKYLKHEHDIIFCYDIEPKTLSNLILQVLNEYDKYLAVGLRGKKNAQKNFDWTNNIERLAQFYNQV